jgi:hypothetical protein
MALFKGSVLRCTGQNQLGPVEIEWHYAPPEFVSAYRVPISGNPDPDRVSTSHVEPSISLRMSIRLMARLVDGPGPKLENHRAAISLCIADCSFCRLHGTLAV